jgi:3-deoxy-manno-octulosonate cytidylyltransferase (CMP-KDO synthetase)
MRACTIIPARFSSSRFPGKPLVPLLGKPMILYVAELASQAVGQEHVFVATDDERIALVVEEAGFSALMTSSDAPTGTDRIAEAAQLIDYDIYVNLQGDEPLVEPEDIRRCIALKSMHPDMIINGFSWIGPEEDPSSVNIPKVIVNEAERLVYISRSLLPGFKSIECAPSRYMKQVCIYGFTLDDLNAFSGFGRKSALENAEDIEILRFFELARPILMYECHPGSLAVDVPQDVERVEAALSVRNTL